MEFRMPAHVPSINAGADDRRDAAWHHLGIPLIDGPYSSAVRSPEVPECFAKSSRFDGLMAPRQVRSRGFAMPLMACGLSGAPCDDVR